ncbi:hypothetical protein JXJ21_12425 [candidate division KSB1 bacterium]|nr:hypothetical protein [candidate division KSB1 bacterium]
MTCRTYIIFLLLLAPMLLLAHNPVMIKLESEIAAIDSVVTEMQLKYDRLRSETTQKSEQVAALKREQSISFIQRQKLESLLQESVALTNEIERLQVQIQVRRKQQNEMRSKLIRLYDEELDRLLMALKPQPAEENRAILIEGIQNIRAKKLAALGEISKQVDLLLPGKIELKIEVNDTPTSLKRKGDFVKDQEERYRKYIAQIDQKITDLRKDRTLRERMADFIGEMAFFDQRDETIQNLKTNFPAADNDAATLGRDAESENYGTIHADSYLLLNAEIQMLASQPPTARSLDELIEKLEQDKVKLKITADSLSQRANEFYKATEALKKIGEKR